MNAPISMIPYANTAPFRHAGPPRGCRFVEEPPSRSVRSLKAGAVWAACIPVGALPDLADVVEPIGNLGIAARGPAETVLLFSKVPAGDLAGDSTLWVTGHTVSSVRLLYLLLRDERRPDDLPRLAPDRDRADARLLIGDEAMLAAEAPDAGLARDYPFVLDLADEWFTRRGVPFVFARWVVRRDAPPEVRRALEDWGATFREREAELVREAVRSESERLALPADRLARYHRIIRRALGPEDLVGQERFLREWRDIGREPIFLPADSEPTAPCNP